MNGKDGKPFKTREGGVMRLQDLIRIIQDNVVNKLDDNKGFSESEIYDIVRKVGLSALNMVIYLIRLLKTIYLIWKNSHPLKEIQGHIFYILL